MTTVPTGPAGVVISCCNQLNAPAEVLSPISLGDCRWTRPDNGGPHPSHGVLALCEPVMVGDLSRVLDKQATGRTTQIRVAQADGAWTGGVRPSRRVFLRSAAAVSAGAVAITAVGACSQSAEVTAQQKLADQLLPQVIAANTDAAAANAAIATNPDRAAALGVVAAERTEHARALTDEITRLDSGRAATASSSSGPSPAQPAPPTIEQLRTQLSASARSAGDLGVELDGYVAGLLGSISASVTTAVAVQLS